MAKAPTLAEVLNLANPVSALAVLEANNDAIEAAFDNTISRDGSTPNQMEADFDLNSHQLLNVADPVADTDGVNKRSVRLLVDEFAAQIVNTAVFGTQIVDTFPPATAGQTSVLLTQPPGSLQNTAVFVNGQAKRPGVDFSLAAPDLRTVVFTVPLNLNDVVFARYSKALPTGITLADSVLYDPAAGGGQTTVENYLDELWTNQGAARIRVRQSGIGAIDRSMQDEVRDIVHVKQFGATGLGVVDDTSAIQAALTHAGTLGRPAVVFMPNGTYRMAAGVTVPLNVSIRGESEFGTKIEVVTNGITVFSCVNAGVVFANITISDLTIATNNTGVRGVRFVFCFRTRMDNISFLGLAQNFEIDRGRYHTLTNLRSSGYNLRAAGSCRIWSSTDDPSLGYCTAVLMSNYHIENVGTGTDSTIDPAAIYIRRGISVLVDHVYAYNLAASVVGPVIPGTDGIIFENDCQGCKLTDSIFVGPVRGIRLQRGAGAAVDPTFTSFVSVDVDQATSNSIFIGQALFTAFTHCMITPNAATAGTQPILLNSGALHTTFTANHIHGFSDVGGSGFYLNGCTYVTMTNNIIGTTYYGFVIVGATHVKSFGNTLYNCTNKFNGTLSGVGNNFTENEGFNPIGSIATPGFPATGVSVTNTMGVPCTVSIAGGTITAYSFNGVALSGVTGNQRFEMRPGDSINIAYTGSPVWTWVAH